MDQYLLEGVLRKHLERHGVHVELATEPTFLEEVADGVNIVLKKTKRDGETTSEILHASYVIGADGAKGDLRQCVRIAAHFEA